MLFSLPQNVFKGSGYASCSECLFALQDVQSIDYYFASNTMMKRYEAAPDNAFFCEQNSVAQMFHVLIALSYFLRQGHSCLSISAIANQTYWADLDQHSLEQRPLVKMTQQKSPLENSTQDKSYQENNLQVNIGLAEGAPANSAQESKPKSKTGFLFTSEDTLQSIIERFYKVCSTRRDIVWEYGNLYTARYANYEDIVASFFKQLAPSENKQTENLKLCVKELWPKLFSKTTSKSIDWQQISVLNGLLSKTSIISGGAGTGKTYTVARLLLSWLFTQGENKRSESKLLLAAPTGKAAQRLNESILGEFSKLSRASECEQVSSLIDALKPMIQAKTIHRLLGLGMYGIEPKYNDKKQLDCDFLVIDEASMIDLAMMAKLLRALPKNAKLVLIGDANQLPSVENGGLLRDLVNQDSWQKAARINDFSSVYTAEHAQVLNQLVPSFANSSDEILVSEQKEQRRESQAIDDKDSQEAYSERSNAINYNHVTFLQKSMRSQTEIGQVAQCILSGKVNEFVKLLSSYKSQSFNSYSEIKPIDDKPSNMKPIDRKPAPQQMNFAMSDEVISWHEDAYTQIATLKSAHIEQIAMHYETVFESNTVQDAIVNLQKYRLLCSTKKGRLGTEFLNKQIEQQLRKRFSQVDPGQIYKGMPIMIVQNDYRLKLFNGDIGVIWTSENGKLAACFSDPENATQYLSFSVSSLPAFELVYAMTIHKTQGSEFEHVDIVLPQTTMGKASAQSAQYLNRELLYTGVTRAQKSIGLFASLGVLKDCIKNSSSRFSGLKRKLLS
jgi:exodeoxyribonuclease V alpha subunit